MIFTTGTITNTVKQAALQNKWQQKKETGNVLSKEERNQRENWTQEDWMKHDFEEQQAKNREAEKRTRIDNKINAGKTLTPAEEEYLSEKDPAALEKYKQAKIEKKAYEEKLKNCKTKDEVQRIKTETMGGFMASLKKIENDPYIPDSEKLAKAQEILSKTRNVEEAERKFMLTSQYANLPTEAEEAKERADETRSDNDEALSEVSEAIEQSEEMLQSEELLESEERLVNEEIENENSENKEIIESEENQETKKKGTKSKSTGLETEIEKTYDRIKFRAELESMESAQDYVEKKNVGKKIDFSV